MQNFTFHNPTRIIFGEGQIATLDAQIPANARVLITCGGGSIKSQFKKADKSGAMYAIIVGEHEMKTHSVSLKSLREDLPQQTLYQDELAEYLKLKIL